MKPARPRCTRCGRFIPRPGFLDALLFGYRCRRPRCDGHNQTDYAKAM